MSVVDLLRSARSSAREALAAPASGQQARWSRPVLGGAAAATISALVLVLPALVVWVASPQSTVDWPEALGIGSALWLVAGGGHVRVDGVTITVVPVLLTVLFAWSATIGARRTLRDTGVPRGWRGWVPSTWLRAGFLWIGGYAGCAALWAAASLSSQVRPVVATLVLPILGLPSIAMVTAMWLERHEATGFRVRDSATRAPGWLLRAIRPAVEGMGIMVLAGLVAVAVLVVVHFDAVRNLHEELRPDVAGGIVLAVGQAALLGNGALWAVSFSSGAGFSVGTGSHTTWAGSDASLMPIVPVLGALPSPGAFPSWVAGSVVLPVLVGGFVGWRALRSVPRLATVRSKALATVAAVVLAALGLAGLDALAGGALGPGRLADIGAPTMRMGLLLAGEFGLGAAMVFTGHVWRVRR